MLLNEIVVDSLTLNLLEPVYIVRKKMTRIRYEHLDAATGPSSCQQMLNLILMKVDPEIHSTHAFS